ncbi:hypothetical protein AO398_16050 [Methylobacterium sp. GXS13]|jgi:hypothetical protein|uniref:hypothetical protein n=1 Tax=Methylobacterium sp. GXS13 TaxID=1730094 RepID=UPI00071BF9C1|nr:hypothetical protein [Methylobacterium sp. GXS13]KST59794.1 hypothetical protein AO398_16050 [Methylobacterium sp. GXS13]
MTDNTARLTEIASAIGVPVETFTQPALRASERTERLTEIMKLIQAFETIEDAPARRRCITFVETTAGALR